ncbi:hypothetical protein BC567DRAFT_225237, partial [Phyllosticta citribraziliensis]
MKSHDKPRQTRTPAAATHKPACSPCQPCLAWPCLNSSSSTERHECSLPAACPVG